MSDEKLVKHARDLRERLNDELPNGVGNTIDALCDRIEGSPKGHSEASGHPSDQAPAGLGASRFDPERKK
jgi:hypothetical protein